MEQSSSSNANYTADYLNDIILKLRDLEEKQTILKDRTLLIGENLVSSREKIDRELAELKIRILELESETKKIKLALERYLDDNNNFVRKNEFNILKRQFEMFEPLELARIVDVEHLIKKALKEHHKK